MPDFQSSLSSLKSFFRDNEAASLQASNKENLQPAVSKAADPSAAMPAPPSRMVTDTLQLGNVQSGGMFRAHWQIWSGIVTAAQVVESVGASLLHVMHLLA